MSKARLEAFSDGVIAILITIMVLELETPEGPNWTALQPLVPVLLAYVMSFVYLGIYWNNHHHMLHAADRVNGKVLWANLHLLFWLSLVPFITRWVGHHHTEALPTAVYGTVFLLVAVAYSVLQKSLIKHQGPQARLRGAVGDDTKGKISLLLYVSAIPLAFVNYWISYALYVAVALIWLTPDPRIERMFTPEHVQLPTATKD